MESRPIYKSAVCAVFAAGWVLVMAGCVAPAAQSESAQSGGLRPADAVDPAPAPTALPAEPASPARLSEYRRRLQGTMPGDDLAEDLYFGWMLEPYERATLAIAVKALAVLEREQQLRQQGRGSLSPERMAAIVAWLDRALGDPQAAVAGGFQPNRIQPAADLAGGAASPAFFTFADRASFTAHDRTLGDLDVLASAGFRWYAWDAVTSLTSAGTARRARAQSMGCALLAAPARFQGERNAPAGSADLGVQPVTLAQLFAGEVSTDGVLAVIDLPGGEDLVGMLARRQLLRGVTGREPVAAIGIDAGGSDPRVAAARVRAAMWLQALAGQRIGVFEGWRDARDGTLTPYPSRFSEPEYLEAVAHTALDLLRYADEVQRVKSENAVSVVLPPAFALSDNENEWSEACLALLGELHTAGRDIDLVPAGLPSHCGAPFTCIKVVLAQAGPVGGFEITRDGDCWQVPVPKNSVLARRAGASIVGLIASGGAAEVREPAPALRRQPPIVQRIARDGRTCVAVNCTDADTSLVVVPAAPGEAASGWTDQLTGERIAAGPVPMRPWQVRLLRR